VPARADDADRPLTELLAARLSRRVWVVHRIDKATSGLVVFALDAAAHKRVSQAFEKRTVHKTYLAAVLGEISDGMSFAPLKTFGSGRVGPSPEGKPSRTRWTVRQRYSGATLLEVEPETGRRHQIRTHLYAVGHPVLGDRKYGKPRPVGGAPRLMLHAWRLALPDGRGGTLELEAPPPPDFQAVLAGLLHCPPT
jgi:23S rRNA-/tRNA-specific pseudouridylate synthase